MINCSRLREDTFNLLALPKDEALQKIRIDKPKWTAENVNENDLASMGLTDHDHFLKMAYDLQN